MLENLMNSPAFMQDDVARMARLVKSLRNSMDDSDRELMTNELRKVNRRSAAAIREHREKHGAPGTTGKGHRMGDDEPKKGRKERAPGREPWQGPQVQARGRHRSVGNHSAEAKII